MWILNKKDDKLTTNSAITVPGEVVPGIMRVEGTAWMSNTIPPIITASISSHSFFNFPPFNKTLNLEKQSIMAKKVQD